MTAEPSHHAVDALAQIAGLAAADEDREPLAGICTKQRAAARPPERLDFSELGANDVALVTTGNEAMGTWL